MKKKKKNFILFFRYFKQYTVSHNTAMSNHSEQYKYKNHSKHGNSV